MIIVHQGFGYEHTVIELLSIEVKVKTAVKFIVKIQNVAGLFSIALTFSNNYPSEKQFIQINDRVFKFQEIMENPYRIYTLMQQDLLQDSIDNLP